MFSRIRPMLKITAFQNVHRCQSTGLTNFLRDLNDKAPPNPDYSLLFFDDKVQQLLKQVSNIEIQKVFKFRPPGHALKTPVYKLMTTEELEVEMNKAYKLAEELMQMPPLVNIRKDTVEVWDTDPSLDGHDKHHSKHIFIDVSYNRTNENRMVVIREPNGVLRTATREERSRVNQIFDPIPGRDIEVPEMFHFENLLDVINRKEYEFILDRACVQFEPDEQLYHNVITLTYEAINYCSDFPMLYSTRHFGSLVFYLITHKKIDNLLEYTILHNRIEDAYSLVKLYHLIHPQSKSGEAQKGKTDMEILKHFIESDSTNKSSLSRSLDIYERKEQSRRELQDGIREAHGV